MATGAVQTFLFLQGPISPFWVRLARCLEQQGHRVLKVNLCGGDRLFWPKAGARDYRGSLKSWPEFIATLMDRERVTDLVLEGEQRPYHRAAIAAAKAQGVTVTVTDYGYLRPDWITLEQDGMGGWSRFPKSPEGVQRLAERFPEPDTEVQFRSSFFWLIAWDLSYHIATFWLSMLFPRYSTYHINHPFLNYIGGAGRMLAGRWNSRRAEAAIDSAIQQQRPYWVFPMQMETDFSIRAYSHFDGMKPALTEILTSFAAHAAKDAHLFVKVHPLDPGLVDWRRFVGRLAQKLGIGSRVEYLDGGDLAKLVRHARGMVTINSTSGISALKSGAPTLVLGQAIYDMDGLTHQEGLDTFWTQGSPPDIALVKAFLRAAAGALHIRGDFYKDPGISAAVNAASRRLQQAQARGLAALIQEARQVDQAPAARRQVARDAGARATVVNEA